MRRKTINALILLMMAVLAGCVTAPARQQEVAAGPTLSAIEVGDNMLTLSIQGEYTYTVYKPSDPYTVSVELPGVDSSSVLGMQDSLGAGISEVEVSQSKTPSLVTRLRISLVAPAEVEATKGVGSLILRLMQTSETGVGSPALEAAAGDSVPMATETEEVPDVDLQPATKIIDVGFDYAEGMINLVIRGNGSMNPDVFTLRDRIVIDIYDVSMEATLPAAVVSPVKAIRQGIYDDKVRLVVDLMEDTAFTASSVADTVLVILPVDEVLDIQTAAPATPMEGAEDIDEEGAAKGPDYSGKIISLDFQNANIVPIFRFLGDVSGYNVVVHPGVSGKVNLKLMNVPWDQALDIILGIFSLESEIKGNIMTIAPSKVFARLEQEKSQRQVVKTNVAELVRKEFRLKYIEVNKLKTRLDEVGVMTPRGKSQIDERRNVFIVRDTEDALVEISKEIKQWDIIEHRQMQIMIEAKIVEVTADSTISLGIKWGGDFSLANYDLDGSFSVNTPPTGAGAGAEIEGGAANFIIGTAPSMQVTLSLEALEALGDLKKISNPRILTLEGQSATIQQGIQIPVATTTAEGSTTEFKNANLSLNVTPTVKPNGVLELKVTANNDTPVSVGSATGINTQSITTTALVKDGETLVLGGIYTNTEEVSSTGIPLISRIPLFGWLFKTQSSTSTTKELLILITPKIIKAEY